MSCQQTRLTRHRRLYRAVLVVGALAAGVLADCVPRREVGRQCVFNSDCAEGLICAGAYCRRPCATDRDCPAGGVCRSAGERDLLACFEAASAQLCVYSSECPSPQVCTVDGTCGIECSSAADCRLRVGRTDCDLATHACIPGPADRDASSGAGADAAAPDGSADGAGS